MWKARFQDLERRRALEIEGYKTDIRMLREKMQTMEKQMYRLILESDRDPGHIKVSLFEIYTYCSG